MSQPTSAGGDKPLPAIHNTRTSLLVNSKSNDIPLSLPKSVQCQLEVHEPSVAAFMLEFEGWVFSDFRCALIRRASELSELGELTSLLVPWSDKLTEIANECVRRAIAPDQAAKLRWLLNYALDGLGKQYLHCGASPTVMMVILWPLEDLMVFLARREKETKQHSA